MGFTPTTGHGVRMRGLPFSATDADVMTFFSPLVPSQIHIHYGTNGRATGEADVEFETHEDASAAMERDKHHMQHRYVELFLQSQPAYDQGYNQSFDVYEPPGTSSTPMPLMSKPLSPRGGGGAYGGGRGGGSGYAGAEPYGAPSARGGARGGAGYGAGFGYGSMSAGGGKMLGRGRGAASAYGAGGYEGGDYASDSYGAGDYAGW